jgi:hypothetical protein
MKFSMTGQEKRVLLIQVTVWAGLTVNNITSRGRHYPDATIMADNNRSYRKKWM